MQFNKMWHYRSSCDLSLIIFQSNQILHDAEIILINHSNRVLLHKQLAKNVRFLHFILYLFCVKSV
jgi:hypothetical protein